MNGSANTRPRSKPSEMQAMSNVRRRGTIDQLRRQLGQWGDTQGQQPPMRISSGVDALDAMLPDGGYRPGMVVEFVSSEIGDAALWMSLHLMTRAMQQRNGSAVLIDPVGDLYPPALVALGIPLERLIVIRGAQTGQPARPQLSWSDAYYALNQSLSCKSLATVWGVAPTTDSRWLRRFQLSAEIGGTLGVLLRPFSVLSHPTWSDVQWHVQPAANGQHTDVTEWRFKLRLMRARNGAGREVELAIDTRSGQLRQIGPVVIASDRVSQEPMVSSPAIPTKSSRETRRGVA